MTKRQISIRVALDGAADVKRETEAIGKAGGEAGKRIVDGFNAASAAIGKYDAAGRRTASASQKDLPGGTYGAAYKGFDDEKAAADFLARQKEFQTKIFGAVRAGAGPVDLGADLQARSARAAASAIAATQKADAARAAQMAQWQREQSGQNFRDDFERRMGLMSRPATESGATVSAFQSQAREMGAMQARADALLAQIDPLAAAQSRLAKETADYNKMLSAGVLTEGQHAKALATSRQQYEQVAGVVERAKRGVSLNSFQMSNLTYQMNDVVSGLAMGQRPLSVMLQQGGQIYQVFAGTGMGVAGALKATALSLSSLVTPTALVAGGIAAITGSLVYMQYAGIRAGKELEAALTGTGRAAGVTASQLNDIAVRAAGKSGVSISQSRTWTEGFAKTGKLPGETSGLIASLVPDYAATTGQDQEAAVKELTAAFSDLGKGVDTLDAKTGAFDAASRQRIKTLTEEGQYAEAARLAYEKMKPSLADHGQQMTLLGRVAYAVKNTDISGAFNNLMRAPTTGEEIRRLQDARTHLQETLKSGNPLTVNVTKGQLAEVEQELSRLYVKWRGEIADTKAKSDAQTAKLLGDLGKPLVQSYSTEVADQELRRRLGVDHYNLRKLRENPAAMKAAGVTGGQVDEGLSAVDQANKTRLSDTAKIVQGYQLQAAAAQAIAPVEKAQIARRQMLLSLSGQTVSATEAEARANAAYAATLQSANYELSRQALMTRATTAQTRAVAGAYMSGGIAGGMEADARRQATLDSLQTGANGEQRFRDLMGLSFATQGESTAQSIARMQAEADARKAMIVQVTSGTAAYAEANRQMQIDMALASQDAAATHARRMGYYDLAAELDRAAKGYRKVYIENDNLTRQMAGEKELADQRKQIDQLPARRAMADGGGGSITPDELSRQCTLLDTNALLEKGYAIQTETGVVLTENGKRYEANLRYAEQMNRELELTQAANDKIYQTQSGIFDGLGDQLSSNSSNWTQYFNSSMQQMRHTMMETGVVNPLKNMVLGGDGKGGKLPTLTDIGGTVGRLLGNAGQSPEGGISDISVTGRSGSLTDMAARGLSTGLGNLFSGDSISDITVTGKKGLLTDMTGQGGGILSWISSLFHNGGDVYGAANSSRVLPASVLRGAPRFHDGVDLKPDEIPAILQTGERVLNRQDAADYRKDKGKSSAAQPTVNFNNYGAPIQGAAVDYDSASNSLNVTLGRAVNASTRAAITGGSLDSAMASSYGVKRVLTQR